MKRAALVLMATLAFPAAVLSQPPAPPAPPEAPAARRSHEARHRRPAEPAAIDRRHPAARDASVSIENLAGSTRVTGWDRAEVQVRGTVSDGAELRLEGTEKRIRITVEPGRGNPMTLANELEVFVPAGCNLEVEGFSASVALSGLTGAATAETVNGSISHSGPTRELRLQSVNGAVESSGAAGRSRVEAVNGTVSVRDATGEVEASTVNGLLTVTGGTLDRVHLETVAGTVRFEARLGPRANLDVQSVSGAVVLVLPPTLDASFSVSTFSGAITNDLGPAAQKKDRWSPEKELVFTSGQGGARIRIETLSGAVRIQKP